jgi:putative NADH-flavin reductase
MKIGIIGATGASGSLIASEAINRNMDVIALIRNRQKLLLPVPYIEKDVCALTRQDIEKLDVLVSTFGVPLGQEEEHLSVTRHLIDILTGLQTRLIVVGSAGHLFSDESRTSRYYETEIPPGILKNGSIMLERVNLMLKNSSGVIWTYFAPAINFIAEAPRTGQYRTGTDVVLRDRNGNSQISYADYASAVLDEIQRPQYLYQLVTAINI